MNKKIIIAIDGCSSTGKSTIAKALAKNLQYHYIDSGAMYRAVTLFALRNGYIHEKGIDTEGLSSAMKDIIISFTRDEKGNPATLLNGENVETEIRSPRISKWVSPISTLGFVREALTKQQKDFGLEKGIVMDGRDIGTTVFPRAELKIFLSARPEVRAKRRYKEMLEKGVEISLQEVQKGLLERDRIDSSRTISPLAKADDAIVFDNSDLTIEEQDQQLLALARQTIEQKTRESDN